MISSSMQHMDQLWHLNFSYHFLSTFIIGNKLSPLFAASYGQEFVENRLTLYTQTCYNLYILLPLYLISINLNKMKTAHWGSSSHIDSNALVKSIISKMMYTCKDPYCKHRVSTCTCTHSDHYNCAGDTRLSRLDDGYGYSFGNKNNPRHGNKYTQLDYMDTKITNQKTERYIRNQQNPQDYYDARKTRINELNESKMCLHGNIDAAGRYQNQSERGRWVNNSLHEGSRMKKLLYESENPFGQIQHGPFGKNYDTQYQIYEQRVRRTKALSPQRQSKIGSLIRRDRDRSSSR